MRSTACILLVLFSIINLRSQTQATLDKLVENTGKNALINGVTLHLVKGDSVFTSSTGNLTVQDQYFIASTTKLYTTAVIMCLKADNKLDLDDPISNFLSSDILSKLHIYKGVDYSNKITIRHLLSQTSGLPDYFEGKKGNGKTLLYEISEEQKDQSWTSEEAIALAKTMQPLFTPGAVGKAHYSDTNYQLLGLIIEKISQQTLEENYTKYIYKKLGLKNTYLFTSSSEVPKSLHYKKDELAIPLAMSSFRADGGIVSTAAESFVFLKAFFDGTLFPETLLDKSGTFNKLFFPIMYGTGYMKITLPKSMNGFKEFPVLYGHSGLSGAFAFYCPEKNMYITGTVNQISHPDIAYKLLFRIIRSIE